MHKLAIETGVQFRFGEEVNRIEIDANAVKRIHTAKNIYEADAVIGGADYQFIESTLLPSSHRAYSEKYWMNAAWHLPVYCIMLD
jgi:phytoene desaturase